MEPWNEQFRRQQEKGFAQKCIEAAVVIYAGFAICVVGVVAESVTIPLASRYRRWRKKNHESG